MSEQTELDLRRQYFGRGLALVPVAPDSPGVDVVLDTALGHRDLAMAEGAENLAQDLQVALLTATGTDLFNVPFGFDGLRVLTDPATPDMTAEMLRLSVMKTVAQDARISRVVDVTLTETEPGSRRYVVRAELLTAFGDLVALSLGSVDAR